VSQCSEDSLAVGEPLAGTAPVARTWVVVENPGPWGRDALRESPLPEPARTVLLAAKERGVGVLLARRPERLDRSRLDGVNVWVARSAAGGVRMRHAVLDSLDPLSGWDLDALAAGVLPALGSAAPQPVLFVCTHGKRDQCCAQRGRALITALLAEADPALQARVWECSHVGGHRFAPVTLSLPSGTVHGRLDVEQAREVLSRQEAGTVLPEQMRGRSCFPEPLQAADIAVRRAEGIVGCDDLDVLVVRDDRAVPVALGWAVPTGSVELEVRHVDGRAWRVSVQHATDAAVRPESCGAEPGPVHAWKASDPVTTTPWR
jgi:hypothetical protein